MHIARLTLLALCLVLGLAACGQDAPPAASAPPNEEAPPPADPTRNAYFGDLHVHTKYSFDSYIFGTRATPDDAYRFARGEALMHPGGIEMQLKAPLDFLAVSDHATYLGMFEKMYDPSSSVGEHSLSVALRSATTPDERSEVFDEILPRERGFVENDDLLDLDIVRGAWSSIVDAAERNNEPGTLTTFIGYEFTAGGRRGENLHRNVIFRGSDVPALPYSRLDAKNNEQMLWNWMDDVRADGMEALAIPHNSNGSDGWMFELVDRVDNPIDREYAEQRMRNEPLVEVTQVKGTSDTHPLLSPNDEWADFEIMEQTIGSGLPSQASGGYVREAYLNGLKMESEQGFNPYRFGLIGSSDTHNAAGSFREDDYWSKTGLLDATPQLRGTVPGEDGEYTEPVRQFWGASGLAAVWAESNTRDAIYDAFRRKETFATSGPRMRVRFFAGYGLEESHLGDLDAVYASGVPMGGDLMANGNQAPRFLVWATQDALVAPLDRLQVIKGWVADGETYEQVFDAACSVGEPDAATHRCSDNGATVDLATCRTLVRRSSLPSGRTRISTEPSVPSTMCACYRTRPVAGLRGMRCVRASRLNLVCRRRFKTARGRHRSGTSRNIGAAEHCSGCGVARSQNCEIGVRPQSHSFRGRRWNSKTKSSSSPAQGPASAAR
jgi:hypothetical protein